MRTARRDQMRATWGPLGSHRRGRASRSQSFPAPAVHGALAICLAVVLPSAATAQRRGQAPFPDNEIAVGFGWAQGFENDVFNIEDDYDVDSALGFALSYYKNLTPAVAVGLHFFGYRKTLEDLILEGLGGERLEEDLDLESYNFGGRLRWTLLRGTFAPYAYAGASWAFGEVEGDVVGSLPSEGFSLVGGFGTALVTTAHVGVSVEALVSTGWSDWDTPPFINSYSADFDPSMFAVLAQLSILF